MVILSVYLIVALLMATTLLWSAGKSNEKDRCEKSKKYLVFSLLWPLVFIVLVVEGVIRPFRKQ